MQEKVGSKTARNASDLQSRARVTLADIARRTGVTRMTVSNALNDRGGVSPDVRENIRRVAKEMGYVSNWAARRLSDTRNGAPSGVVGVIAEIHTPFMAEVAASISSALRDSGRDLLIYSMPEPGRDLPGNVMDLLLHAVDGVISVLPRRTSDLPALVRGKVPLIVVDPLEDRKPLPSVMADGYGGARLAVDHLVALGHRHIAFLAGEPERCSAIERLRGYRAGMKAARLPVEEADIVAAGYLEGQAERACESLLSRHRRPTAIFAANDMSAIGAMAAIRRAGLTIPDDVSIVGFDDIQAAAQVSPGLTTVRQPFAQIGASAVGLLLDMICGRKTTGDARLQVELPVELVTRGTTGPA